MQQDTVLPCPAFLLAEVRVGVLSCPSDVASANLTAMKRPAVFFDRDNTLIANDGYLGDASQVKLIAGAADAVARVRELGYATVIISNQSGVARGLFDEAAVQAVDARMAELLLAQNPAAIIDRHEFCPYHPQAVVEQYRQDSPLRKPRPGMLLAAADAMELDLSNSWLIGDAPRDIAAGKAAGCRTILFSEPDLPPSPAAKGKDSDPDFVVSSLNEAVDVIARNALPRKTKLVMTAPAAPRLKSDAPVMTSAKPQAAQVKLEGLAEQIVVELRRLNHSDADDFSVSKLLAGVVQVLALATLLLGYLQARGNVAWLQIYVLVALTLQTMTIALLIMSRQK